MLNLVYWSEENYGDALSPQLIEALSGKPTQLKHAYKSKFRRFIKGLVTFSKSEIDTILFPWQDNILGVGSIIVCGNKNSTVWGSGFMSNSGKFIGKKICAVRGPYTAQRLVDQGYNKCDVFGDPALLLPLWIENNPLKKYNISIIPHWKETEKFMSKYGDRYNIIDLRSKDVESITKEIISSEYILSTSLHGLIVGHAYGIPSLWIKDGYIESDGFKFYDYFSSVNIEEYDGFDDIDEILKSNDNWRALFENNTDKSIFTKPLKKIQQDLIRVAPFSVLEKYKKMVNL